MKCPECGGTEHRTVTTTDRWGVERVVGGHVGTCECPVEGPRCNLKDAGEGECGGYPEERFSLGLPAGTWCDKHWKVSGYRDEPASAFDPGYAGERYEDDF